MTNENDSSSPLNSNIFLSWLCSKLLSFILSCNVFYVDFITIEAQYIVYVFAM